MDGQPILGLINGATFEDQGFYNRTNRRRIFHDFPTGHFPLTGLLSLMEDERADSYKFSWFEKRMSLLASKLKDGTGGPITESGGNVDWDDEADLAAGTTYRFTVLSSAKFQVRQQIEIRNVPVTGGGTANIQGIVESIPASDKIEMTVISAVANVTNTNAAAGTAANIDVYVVGNASAEGATSGSGVAYPPIDPENQTQIFRTPFEFTATVLQVPTEFDETGIYAETAEDALRQHMVELEMAFLFGQKGTQQVTIDGVARPRRTTGGLIWFLKQWEAADSIYRGGTGAAAVTANSDDNKRILKFTGTVTEAVFDGYIERLFRVTNSKSFEKLVLCGNGALGYLNAYLKTASTLNRDFGAQKVYGMNVLTWESPWGTLHFKTHPLFNLNPALRNDMIAVDVQNLKYRYLNERDTDVLPNRQAPDFDGRKDEWLTEAGLEVRFPESHMYFQNFAGIAD